GGYRGPGSAVAVSTLYRYQPRLDRWSRLPRAPTARAALAVGVIGHELYAAGGANAGKALETLEIYDSNRRRWSAGPSMSTARENLPQPLPAKGFTCLEVAPRVRATSRSPSATFPSSAAGSRFPTSERPVADSRKRPWAGELRSSEDRKRAGRLPR